MAFENKRKLALVLSGGGIKAAAFHIGVCIALKEKGFRFAGGTKDDVAQKYPGEDSKTFRLYVGSSAGAVMSSLLASGHEVEAIIDAFQMGAGLNVRWPDKRGPRLNPLTYRHIFSINGMNLMRVLPNFLRTRSLVTGGIEALVKNGFKINGLFTTRGIARYLAKEALITDEFSNLGVELFIIATQLNHSRKVIFGNFSETTKNRHMKYANYASISDAVGASASLPPVFAPYGIRNVKGKEIFFFDGEIRDTLSTHVAADHGADLVISSYSIQPYHYTEEMGSLHNYGIPLILNQALYQLIEQKIEKHIRHQSEISAIVKAINGYCRQINLAEEHREKLIQIIAERVQYRANTDYIYIHPSPRDYEMFFVDHFSLNPQILGRIVKIGFKSAMSILRKHNI